jgi:hypothetical protein
MLHLPCFAPIVESQLLRCHGFVSLVVHPFLRLLVQRLLRSLRGRRLLRSLLYVNFR